MNNSDEKINTSDALKKIEITKDFVKHVANLDDDKKQQILSVADNAKRLIYENKQFDKSDQSQYQNNRRIQKTKKQTDDVNDSKFGIVDGKFDTTNDQRVKTAEIVKSVTDQLNNYLVKKEVIVQRIETPPYIDNTARLELQNKNKELLEKSRLLENKNVTLEREAIDLNTRLLIQTNEVDRLQRALNQKTSEYRNLELLYRNLISSETALKQKLSNVAVVIGIDINADLVAAIQNIIRAKEQLEIDKTDLQAKINLLIVEINNLTGAISTLRQQLSTEKKDVADKTIKIEEMKKEIIKKEKEIIKNNADHVNAINLLKKTLHIDYQGQIKELRKQYQEIIKSQNETRLKLENEHKQKITSLMEQISELTKKKSDTEKDIAELIQQHNLSMAELKQSHTLDVAKYATERQSIILNKTKEQSENKLTEVYEGKLSDLQKKIKELQESHEQKIKELTDRFDIDMKTFQSEKEKHEKIITALKSENETLKNKLQEIQKQNQMYLQQIEEKHQLQLTEEKNKIQTIFEKEKITLHTEYEKKQNEFEDEKKQINLLLSDHNNKITKLQDVITENTKKIINLESQLETVQQLNNNNIGQLQSIENKQEQLDNDLPSDDDLTDAILNIENNAAKKNSTSAELNEKEEEIIRLKNNIIEIERQLEKSEELNKTLLEIVNAAKKHMPYIDNTQNSVKENIEKKYAILKKQISEKNLNMTETTQYIKSITDQLRYLKQYIEQNNKTVEIKTNENKTLIDKLNDQKSIIDSSNEQITLLNEENRKLDETLKRLEIEIVSMRTNAQKSINKANDAHAAEKYEMVTKINALSRNIEILHDKNTKLTAVNQQLENDTSDLQNENNVYKGILSKRETNKEKITEQVNLIDELNKELEALKSDYNKVNQQWIALNDGKVNNESITDKNYVAQDTIISKSKEIERLTSELTNANNKVKKLEEEIIDLNREMKKTQFQYSKLLIEFERINKQFNLIIDPTGATKQNMDYYVKLLKELYRIVTSVAHIINNIGSDTTYDNSTIETGLLNQYRNAITEISNTMYLNADTNETEENGNDVEKFYDVENSDDVENSNNSITTMRSNTVNISQPTNAFEFVGKTTDGANNQSDDVNNQGWFSSFYNSLVGNTSTGNNNIKSTKNAANIASRMAFGGYEKTDNPYDNTCIFTPSFFYIISYCIKGLIITLLIMLIVYLGYKIYNNQIKSKVESEYLEY